MRLLRSRSLGLALMLAVSMLTTLTLGLALAQDKTNVPDDPKAAPAKEKPVVKDAKDLKNGKDKRKGRVAAGGAPPKKNRPNGADPLAKNGADAKAAAAKAADPDAKAAAAKAVAFMADPVWPFHFQLKISGGDGAAIAAMYYPPKSRYNAPTVLLVHDRGPGRSGKDWQEPLDELKGLSLAESLQEQGYAVLVPDLRGHGANPRKELTANEWRALPADIQAMYLFLVDRHNRGDLNLAKFGVIAIGDGANLATAWASLPGAAISSEGRTSDLSAMVLISPVELANGLPLIPIITPIASKLPIYVLCGDRDASSIKVVKDVQPTIERNQRSKVTYYDTPLHGYRLLHLFPKVAGAVTKFLEDPVKGRVLEWEPRYLLTPVTYVNEGVFESKSTARVTEATKKSDAAAKKAEPEKKKDN